MPPTRSRLGFPKSVMDKGFTSLPNALDDLGLGPYHYRVLVFIVRWKGKATLEKPCFAVGVEYIARKTGISVSKVKEVIHDLEHEYHLIAVLRRKRLRNLYDIRPLFAALLRNHAGPKMQATGPDLHTSAVAPPSSGSRVEPAPEPGPERDGPRPSRPRFGKPRYDDEDVEENQREHDEATGEGDPLADAPSGPRGFGKPSYAPDNTIHPGMDEDDPTYDQWREEEEVRVACERGEYIRGLTSIILWDGQKQVIPRSSLRNVMGDPSLSIIRE